ncbi:MAG: hypothetical protein GQF41_1664 [Candidatus Rifleibacterium amylolyticum]|nr:MAG: hypothetical protein GQF41_1664 [Candidatus Rifleibacterium amylolyticum]
MLSSAVIVIVLVIGVIIVDFRSRDYDQSVVRWLCCLQSFCAQRSEVAESIFDA